MSAEPIRHFKGEHAFLSNFYPETIWFSGTSWRTSEHLYQACKTEDHEWAQRIHHALTPGQAKRIGQHAPLRPDWETVRVPMMRLVLGVKFRPGSTVSGWLLATGDAELIESNTWGDRFWGVCKGEGENHLGRLLMTHREWLRGVER
jgi:ribA/ribD-fused uncharacterized protein